MNDRTVFLGLVSLVVLLMIIRKEAMTWRLASSTNKTYYVKNLPDAHEAASHLATLDTLLTRFLAYLESRSPDDRCLVRIRERWSGTLSETPGNADNVAYSIGKNSIYICVREKSGKLADVNTSMFVLIHEIAHVATDSIGHTREFWRNMKYLLEMAEEAGVYTYVNHDKTSESLCGRTLGSNPLTCVKEKTCASEKKI